VKSMNPRARKVARTPLSDKSARTKSEVRRAGITCTCKFNITRKRKKGKEKWTETA